MTITAIIMSNKPKSNRKWENTMAKQPLNEEHTLPSLSLVLGYIAIKKLQRLEDRIAILARLGYGNAEIATICNTTTTIVRKSVRNAHPP